MMEKEEMIKAVCALTEWFKSQSILPGDASNIMVHLISRLMVNATKDVGQLQNGLLLVGELLMVEVAAALEHNRKAN